MIEYDPNKSPHAILKITDNTNTKYILNIIWDSTSGFKLSGKEASGINMTKTKIINLRTNENAIKNNKIIVNIELEFVNEAAYNKYNIIPFRNWYF